MASLAANSPSALGDQTRFFSASLAETDPEIAAAVQAELGRQREEIELIASENIVSRAVLEAQGSVLTNKYAEGYPGKRYYGGCQFVDVAENLAIDRAKKLFGCGFANVQPNSGSQANQAVFFALMQPGDTFLGLNLAAGGHLTHGSPVNMSGKWFNAVAYGVREDDQRIDYDAVAQLADQHKPKVIVAGGSAYPRLIDFARMRQNRRQRGRQADGGHGPFRRPGGRRRAPRARSPMPMWPPPPPTRPCAGPRGGMILTNDEELAKKFNSAIFPGIQGGPLMHVIAAKAVAFGEALRPEFKIYAKNVVENARALAENLRGHGFNIVSDGTDTHLMLVDLRPKRLTGKVSETALGRAHITCNKNGHSLRSREAGHHVGGPARHPGRDHPRLRRGGIPAGGRHDRRSAGRAVAEGRGGRFAGGAGGA